MVAGITQGGSIEMGVSRVWISRNWISMLRSSEQRVRDINGGGDICRCVVWRQGVGGRNKGDGIWSGGMEAGREACGKGGHGKEGACHLGGGLAEAHGGGGSMG